MWKTIVIRSTTTLLQRTPFLILPLQGLPIHVSNYFHQSINNECFFAEDCRWLHVFCLLPFAGIQLNIVYIRYIWYICYIFIIGLCYIYAGFRFLTTFPAIFQLHDMVVCFICGGKMNTGRKPETSTRKYTWPWVWFTFTTYADEDTNCICRYILYSFN